ncbi:MAG TPA: 1-(5-phosphoribosyl)-5-[(5-phosphoribosylamino)methylideneamino]imidazole-4-carboxamide isomerase [Candidatus Coproplasma stercorigallinarum]|nr:1-(5-phosphoribosyl)-5-[(5-phosphoribosylamino)methylideneamino]imidazole-4-carboxamide isomerase [Candidatus Coproplasma stercorigallinarum]
MKIYPAIDIRGGNVVRLLQGDYDRETVYSLNPVEVARKFKEAGATCLHVVDLDGALEGDLINKDIIKRIVSETGLYVEAGGGVRSLQRIEQYLSAGVSRVILGSAAAENFTLVVDAVKFFGGKVAVGVDAKDGKVAVHGWKKVTDIDAVDFCRKLREVGLHTVIYTDISRDGMLGGANLAAYEELVKIKGLRIIASGGISGTDEIKKLTAMNVRGVVLGKALYDGVLDLKKTIEECQDVS